MMLLNTLAFYENQRLALGARKYKRSLVKSLFIPCLMTGALYCAVIQTIHALWSQLGNG